jgi:thiol-disulfide isomerase/thioredoxin
MVKSYAGIITAPKIPQDCLWLNVEKPIDIQQLKGNIIILAFWNCACIECYSLVTALEKLQKEFPYILVVYVQSPSFTAQKDISFIKDAVRKYDITQPVVVDNKFSLWQAYGIQGWPSVAVIDPLGKITGTFLGEDIYENLKPVINGLAHEFSLIGLISHRPVAFTPPTRLFSQKLFAFPVKIIYAPERNSFFISDAGNHKIIECDTAGKLIQTIGIGKKGSENGNFETAAFFAPHGLAWDSANNALYVADTFNCLIRKVDFKSQTITNLAGNLEHKYIPAKKGRATEIALHTPLDLFLHNNKLYIAMGGLHQIWTLNLSDNQMEVFCGSGFQQLIDGALPTAALALPTGICFHQDTLFFTEGENSSLRYIQNNQVYTLIGKGLFEHGDSDGKAANANLQFPQALICRNNKIYIADTFNHKIKVFDRVQKEITTLIGSGKKGNSNASGLVSEIAAPFGLAFFDDCLFFTDTYNSCVKKYDFVQDKVDVFLD